MKSTLSRAKLEARHDIEGALVLDTALHIGGGRIPSKGTDSPIVRDGAGRPYIPGSSLKGALRAAVERIVPNLGISACGLYDAQTNCLSALAVLSPQNHRVENFRELQEALGKPLDGALKTKITTLLNGTGKSVADLPHPEIITEENLIFLLEFHLCQVCKAFGSPFLASAIFFHDAPVLQWLGLTQVRDGVGIDRDSGRAVEGFKYDYEIIPPQTQFKFSMTIETNDPIALGLAALALHELKNGNLTLGGIRSRGLGRCHLEADNTKVCMLNLTDPEALKAYLMTQKTAEAPLNSFIETHLKNLWMAKEDAHV